MNFSSVSIGFLAEIGTARRGRRCKAIGLVDEQNAVERLAAFVECLGRGLSDIAGDEPGAVGFDHMSFAQNLQPAADLADQARDLGLADAGRPGEHHVLAERGNVEALDRAASARPACARSGL